MGKVKKKVAISKRRRTSPEGCQNSVRLINYFGIDYADRIFLFRLIVRHKLYG